MEQRKYHPGLGSIMVFIGLLAAYFLTFFVRMSASVVLPILASEWNMSAALTSFISSLYFYAYAAMQPLSGALNDRFGPSKVVSIGLLVSSVGAIIFAIAKEPLLLSVGRLLTGLGLAPMLSGALVYQGATFDPSKYSFFSGLIFFIGNLGAVISVAPLGKAISTWGRAYTYYGIFLITVILAMMLFWGRRYDQISSVGENGNIDISEIMSGLKAALKIVFSSKEILAICAVWTVLMGSLMSLQGLWAVTWSKIVYGFGPDKAMFWATLIGIGVMVGSVIGAMTKVEKGARRRLIAFCSISYSAAWLALVAMMRISAPYQVTACLGFVIGLVAGINQPHLTAAINEIAPKGRGGSVFGAVNMLVFITVIIAQSLTGILITGISKGAAYTQNAFLGAFGVLAVATAISLFAIPGFVRNCERSSK